MRLPRGAPGALGDRRRRKKEIHFVGTKCCMDESRVAACNVVLGSLWGWHRNGGQCWVSFIAFLMGEAQRVPCGAINRMARAKTRTKTSPVSSPFFMDVQIGVQEEHLAAEKIGQNLGIKKWIHNRCPAVSAEAKGRAKPR